MRKKKGLAYYLRVLLSSFIAILLYGLYRLIRGQDTFTNAVTSMAYLPFLVTFFLWFYDLVSTKLFSRFDKRSEALEFNAHMSKKIREELDYQVEDFRRLREHHKFQRALEDLYQVYSLGESELINYEKINRQFRNDDPIKSVVDIMISETKALREKYK